MWEPTPKRTLEWNTHLDSHQENVMAYVDSPEELASTPDLPPQETRQTGWVGMVVFAAVVMIMMGIFHAIAGLVGIFQEEYFLVPRSDLVVHVDYTAWGWTYLIGGIIIGLAGVGLLAGQMWARVVGVILAVLSAVLNLAFFAAYPWWSAIMIALDVLVIWALTVHGSEIKNEPRY
jgi:hypothetical protein